MAVSRGDEDDGPARSGAARSRLAEAARLLRENPEPDWPQVRTAVVATVRRAPRGSWPVLADTTDLDADGGADGAVLVSEQVVRVALARGVAGAGACALERAVLRVDGVRLTGVELSVVAGFGPSLHGVADRVRRAAVGVLAEVLGAAPAGVPVGVRVVDVVPGDPRR